VVGALELLAQHRQLSRLLAEVGLQALTKDRFVLGRRLAHCLIHKRLERGDERVGGDGRVCAHKDSFRCAQNTFIDMNIRHQVAGRRVWAA
jgi:hypothetical protein